ncbi:MULTISPECIES: crossover junction endodeoxyribonuclease RuvC [unclassified Frigoribacterium]|uniref:crossover junction endodeoxyribonuclease RuvC n=1 Tax=unclassified Frigoribacterium TaxID=2627005 RepID=UPI0006F7AD0E|nr:MULTISPECIES: crossover junction endodeoxyribonuclease RuvC [unclassified Frigoribacterium]KQO46995.1 Holliday junction resolvase [Frigoribacterium sp. Leaf254]KQT39088.1 Holliday junction resolvase [Frigoribacterium sp. Leaf415]
MTLRVLGIDPGLTRCGVGVVEVDAQRRATLVDVQVIRTTPDLALELRLLALGRGLEALIDEHRPDAMAIERVFAQQNVRSVMGVAQVSGLALRAAAERDIPVTLHTPSEVKAAVTGYGSADKKQVGAMVARLLGLAEAPRPADAADALALAICHAWRGAPVAARASSGSLTPAQRAWRDAEKSVRTPRLGA